jgi:hypothetical protein
MNGDGEFDPHDVRLMQGLAQRVTALRPELVNNVATVGELAWVWGMGHHDDRDTWRPSFVVPPRRDGRLGMGVPAP